MRFIICGALLFGASISASATGTYKPGSCSELEKSFSCETVHQYRHPDSCYCPYLPPSEFEPPPGADDGQPHPFRCTGMSYPFYDEALGLWTCISMGH